MAGRKEIVARLIASSGATRIIEALPGASNLIVINYHRIGDAQRTPFDSGVFSCTAAEFDQQIGHLKKRFPVINLEQAVSIIHGTTRLAEPSVLLTFDDGYLDNYQQAFPALRRHGLSATFFLATAFVGTGTLPWWDVIAYILKNSSKDRITLRLPETMNFNLTGQHRTASIRRILDLFKHPSVTDTEAFITKLEEVCGSKRPTQTAKRRFLNWDEAREMERSGMCFGSHTHTHEILSRLSPARQLEELQTSRDTMEKELGHAVESLAYPVGRQDSFSDDTIRALRTARYHTAFSLYGGTNRQDTTDPFNVLRSGVGSETFATFRLRMAMRTITERELF